MLKHQLKIITENDEDSHIIVEDKTGNYDASTNTTGYGAPNEARADQALFAIKTNANNGVEKIYYPDNVLTATEVTVDLERNGVHLVYLASLPYLAVEPDLSLYSEGDTFYFNGALEVFINENGEKATRPITKPLEISNLSNRDTHYQLWKFELAKYKELAKIYDQFAGSKEKNPDISFFNKNRLLSQRAKNLYLAGELTASQKRTGALKL